MKNAKHELRQHYLKLRQAMSPHDVALYSEQILKNLSSLEAVQRAGSVHLYLSSSDRREVDTMAFITWCFRERKAVFVPFVTETGQMLHVRLHPDRETYEFASKIRMGRFGMPEPIPVEPMNDQQLQVDLVIVPGVAFDTQGHRLGYGKGYYDRFLATRPSWVKTIGLAYDDQCLAAIPTEATDIAVQLIVTPQQIIKPIV